MVFAQSQYTQSGETLWKSEKLQGKRLHDLAATVIIKLCDLQKINLHLSMNLVNSTLFTMYFLQPLGWISILADIDAVYTGAKWNRSEIGTNGPCACTRTVGTLPFETAIHVLLPELKRQFHLEPLGSSVNGQKQIEPNQKEPNQKRMDTTMRYDSFVRASTSPEKCQRKLDFCD